MKFEQIYSSSRGNLYIVTAQSGQQLLLECGAKWADIQKALNYDLSNVVACLLTHEHKDHSKAVRDVLKAGINVCASQGTLDALGITGERRATPLETCVSVGVGGFLINQFHANHDAVAPLIFVVGADKEYLLFAPDTRTITQRFKVPFNIIAIECSYNNDILQKRVDINSINEEVAKRLLTSHMEKQTTIRYFSEFCDLSKCREIHLLHMSRDNIDKEATRAEFEKKLFIETIICRK